MPVVQDVCGRDVNDLAFRRCFSAVTSIESKIFAIGGFAAVASEPSDCAKLKTKSKPSSARQSAWHCN